MWGYMGNYGWGMGIGMVLFWGLLAAAIMVLIRNTRGSGSAMTDGQQEKPLDILKERYARGEIEREEFEQKKHDLEN